MFQSYAVEPVDLIDFRLPSGNLWTICNVGAEKPWDTGDYFAWGETAPKTDYSWETYKYCNGMWNGMTKYVLGDEYCAIGFSDSLKQLEPADDVAYTTLGEGYTIPTVYDWLELHNNCYMLWTDNYNNTGVQGCIIYQAKNEEDKGSFCKTSSSYSITDVHIFLPAGGYKEKTAIKCKGSHCVYWTSTLTNISNNGVDYIFFVQFPSLAGEVRCNGLLVRAIKKVSTPKNE